MGWIFKGVWDPSLVVRGRALPRAGVAALSEDLGRVASRGERRDCVVAGNDPPTDTAALRETMSGVLLTLALASDLSPAKPKALINSRTAVQQHCHAFLPPHREHTSKRRIECLREWVRGCHDRSICQLFA